MKAGDTVWVRVTYEGIEDVQGFDMERFYHQPSGDELIPDSPALPAVARWLADGQETIGELRASFQEIHDVAEPDLTFRNADLVTLLDALLAALTEAGE